MTADALGGPVRSILTGGRVHDMAQAGALTRGIPTGHVIADGGYDSDAFVRAIEPVGAEAVIPSRGDRTVPRAPDAHLYKGRSQVERLSARLKRCRRVAARYEKTARDYLAFCQLASAMVLLA